MNTSAVLGMILVIKNEGVFLRIQAPLHRFNDTRRTLVGGDVDNIAAHAVAAAAILEVNEARLLPL